MILDAYNTFSDAQALTATAASENVIALGAEGRIGSGEPMGILIVVDVALDFTSANETYAAQLQSDDNEAFSSAVARGPSLDLPGGSAAGSQFILPVSPNVLSESFIRLNYTLGGTTPTGTLSAYLLPMSFIDKYAQYPKGYTIS